MWVWREWGIHKYVGWRVWVHKYVGWKVWECLNIWDGG